MARQRFAPSHSMAGPHLFVPLDDSAWDADRISAEILEIELAAGYKTPNDPVERVRTSPAYHGPDAHPVRRYWSGLTRFDLEAEGVGDYLDRNKRPEIWELRPLTISELQGCAALQAAGRYTASQTAAWLAACKAFPGADDDAGRELDKALRAGAPEARLLELAAAIAYEIPETVGDAVLRLSRDLTEDEKKRSAGRPGETSAGASPAV